MVHRPRTQMSGVHAVRQCLDETDVYWLVVAFCEHTDLCYSINYC